MEPGYYWAWLYGGRELAVIEVTKEGKEFWAFGNYEEAPLSECKIVAKIEPPKEDT